MSRFLLTAFGPDGYGIVARVTSALADLNCNIADSTMSNLSGHFAIMLVIDGNDDLNEKMIYDAVQNKCSEFSLMVDIKEVAEHSGLNSDGDRYVVSVYGTDRPGIVAGICEILAVHKANIFDLTTRVIETGKSSIYTMVLEVALASPLDFQALESALANRASNLDVHCSIRPSDSEEL